MRFALAPGPAAKSAPSRPRGHFVRDSWFLGGKANNLVPGSGLNAAQVGADCGEVAMKSASMFHAVLSDFLDNRVFHLSSSDSSSDDKVLARLSGADDCVRQSAL